MKLHITDTVYFVEQSKQVVASLFSPTNGSTASGTFKIKKRGVLFFDLKGEPFIYLCANEDYTPFFVSCFTQDDGRIRYMFALDSNHEQQLGFAGKTFGEERAIALKAWESAKEIAATRKAERSAPKRRGIRPSAPPVLAFTLPDFLR